MKIDNLTGSNLFISVSDITIDNKEKIKGLSIEISEQENDTPIVINLNLRQATKLLCKLYTLVSEIEDCNTSSYNKL